MRPQSELDCESFFIFCMRVYGCVVLCCVVLCCVVLCCAVLCCVVCVCVCCAVVCVCVVLCVFVCVFVYEIVSSVSMYVRIPFGHSFCAGVCHSINALTSTPKRVIYCVAFTVLYHIFHSQTSKAVPLIIDKKVAVCFSI